MAGTGSIRKLGEKRYQVRVTLGTDAKGKRTVHTRTVHGTKREAEEYLAAKIRERDTGRLADPTKLSVGSFLEQWLHAKEPGVRERTFNDYSDIVEKRLKPRLGAFPLDKLTPLLIQTVYSDLTGAGYSSQTVRNTHTVLHSALKQAVKWRMLPFNPAADMEMPRRERREMKALDTAAAQKFIEAAKQEPRGIAYLVGLFSGMRPGEYLALQWPDLNLNTGATKVQRTIFWPRGGGWRFEATKTAGSRRTVILPKKLLLMLREHKARQNERRLLLGELWEDHDLLFTGETGGPLQMGKLNTRHFKKILKAAGLPPNLRPYDLRHSCATILLEQGENLKVVSERLGHASITLTADVYSHVTPGMQQAAADKLDGLL